MTCNATWTTYTLTDDVVTTVTDGDRRGTWADEAIPDGMAVVRDGDQLKRLGVITLTCEGTDDDACVGMHFATVGPGTWVEWHDDTPGATPHTDPSGPFGTDREAFDVWSASHTTPEDRKSHTDPADEHRPCAVDAPCESCRRHIKDYGFYPDLPSHSHADNTPPADCEHPALVANKCKLCGATPPHLLPIRTPPADEHTITCPDCGEVMDRSDDARHGCTPPADVCPDCDGSGLAPAEDYDEDYWSDPHRDLVGDCPSCGGTGTVHWDYDDHEASATVKASAPCPDCDGAGELLVDFGGGTPDDPDQHADCPSCGGEGVIDDAPLGDFPLRESGTVSEQLDGPPVSICPSCGGTGDRPAVTDHPWVDSRPSDPYCAVCERHRGEHRPTATDTERRIRETVEGKGAWKHFTAEARLIHIAGLLDTEYVPTEKIPGWKPPAVTDEQVDAAARSLYSSWGHNAPSTLRRVRAALEAAAATRPTGTTINVGDRVEFEDGRHYTVLSIDPDGYEGHEGRGLVLLPDRGLVVDEAGCSLAHGPCPTCGRNPPAVTDEQVEAAMRAYMEVGPPDWPDEEAMRAALEAAAAVTEEE